MAVTPAVPARYDQVKDKAKAALIQDRKIDAWTAWETKAFADASVRYGGNYRPADPTSVATGVAPAVPTGAPAPAQPGR